MGRSCKKIKAKLSSEEESRNLIIYKTDDLISNQIINDIIGQSSNQTFHFPKKFKYWLNAQFETIRNNEYLSNRFNFKQNETIKFDLSVEINDLFLMSVLKDKVYQIYKQHIKESLLINETKKRLKNNDYIDSSAITKNGYQLSKNRLNLAFGSFLAYLFILAHAKFKELDLSENEIALLYALFLFSCDGILIFFLNIFNFIYYFI